MQPPNDFTGNALADSLSGTRKDKSYTQERINARHEIERRAELKALKDELDDWDDFDEDDL